MARTRAPESCLEAVTELTKPEMSSGGEPKPPMPGHEPIQEPPNPQAPPEIPPQEPPPGDAQPPG